MSKDKAGNSTNLWGAKWHVRRFTADKDSLDTPRWRTNHLTKDKAMAELSDFVKLWSNRHNHRVYTGDSYFFQTDRGISVLLVVVRDDGIQEEA